MPHGKKVYVKPANATKEESELWDRCVEKHDDYKKYESESAKNSDAIKKTKTKLGSGKRKNVSDAEMKEFCRFLGERIDLVNKVVAGRQHYIDFGCDKIHWDPSDNTSEQDRRESHEGQVEETKNQVENLKTLRKKYCLQPPPPPPPPPNPDLPNS